MALQGGNGPHDVGGRVDLLGIPLQQDEEDSGWGTECHALFVALTKKSILSTDELRRGVEGLSEEAHATWGYYARWIAAITGLLQEKDVISPGSLEAQLAGDAVERRDPRFVEGNCVRVRSESSARTTWRRPHVRTPAYLHGATGIVESVVGRFQDPSMLAYGIRNMPEQHLYRVRFKQGDVWPNAEMSDDTIDVEVYDHWLVEDGAAAPPPATTIQHQATHGGEHAHAHAHASRGMTEAEAVRREGPPHPGEWLYRAVVALLISQGIVAQDEIVRYAQALECAGQALPAARLVARAWCDDGFRCRLLSDATSAAREMGIDASNPNAPTVLRVMENEAHVHNLIVCTLCSCYPASVLGPSPSWYKSRQYRARAVREPRRLLREAFGLDLPQATRVRVHDSTADCRYFVLPERPPNTEGWTEEQLAAIVTRNALIGVERIKM